MESIWSIPIEARNEIYKRCTIPQLISLSCCNSAFHVELKPVLWKTIRIPMQILSGDQLWSSVKLDNLRHTRTLRFDYRKWFAYDTMNLRENFEILLRHCNPVLLNRVEDAHEDMVTTTCKVLINLRFLSLKCPVQGNLVSSLCTLHCLAELHLTEKQSDIDVYKICSSLLHLKSLRMENVTDQDLFYMKQLVKLETLDISRSKVTDDGLFSIHNLVHLKNLHMKGCINVTDKGVPSLLSLTSLQRLDMSGCRVTDKCIFYFTRLPCLTYLALQETYITDAGLIQISKIRSLRKVNIAACDFVTNVGIGYLSDLAFLEELNVGHTCFSDDGMSFLQQLYSLQILDMSHTKITDQGLAYVSSMQRLHELVCAWNAVTDAGIRHLFALTSLKRLNVIGCKNVTNKVLSHLYRKVPLDRIDFAKVYVCKSIEGT